mmetsp:Transcript_68206/g.215757  ORF Transcript_68206/g.215757 Transcript_68206/m.215757 type:complete len:239 (-) Transcript_68206:87-803(-)
MPAASSPSTHAAPPPHPDPVRPALVLGLALPAALLHSQRWHVPTANCRGQGPSRPPTPPHSPPLHRQPRSRPPPARRCRGGTSSPGQGLLGVVGCQVAKIFLEIVELVVVGGVALVVHVGVVVVVVGGGEPPPPGPPRRGRAAPPRPGPRSRYVGVGWNLALQMALQRVKSGVRDGEREGDAQKSRGEARADPHPRIHDGESPPRETHANLLTDSRSRSRSPSPPPMLFLQPLQPGLY